MNEDRMLRVGITGGDTNGIGYEVILKMLSDNRLLELCTPVVFGSLKVMNFYRKALNFAPINFHVVTNVEDIKDGDFNLVNVSDDNINVVPGVATAESGAAAFAALEAGVKAATVGAVDALVTAPIDKHFIQSDKFRFPGHTEYLRDVTGAEDSLMILFNENVKVALVTTHLPVSEIASAITQELIEAKLQLFNASLKADFSIVQPRIAVLALNPHAGDGGLLGKEESEIITPAIKAASQSGILCFGPYSADGFFGAGLYKKFDGVLAMYHDQGLAPFKSIAMDSGVNFTAALPIVRTSPDHGTGADIAGQGIASEESIRAALYAAIDIYRCRERDAEAYANPLKRQYFDRSKDNVVLDLK